MVRIKLLKNRFFIVFFSSKIKGLVSKLSLRKGTFSDGILMGKEVESKVDIRRRVHDLQSQVDELKELVNTLLSVICEEPDGVHTGSAPTIPGQSASKFCM